MTGKERKLEDLLTEISADAKALRIVFDDMLLNDLENTGDRIFMGQVFADRLCEAARQASDVLIAKE